MESGTRTDAMAEVSSRIRMDAAMRCFSNSLRSANLRQRGGTNRTASIFLALMWRLFAVMHAHSISCAERVFFSWFRCTFQGEYKMDKMHGRGGAIPVCQIADYFRTQACPTDRTSSPAQSVRCEDALHWAVRRIEASWEQCTSGRKGRVTKGSTKRTKRMEGGCRHGPAVRGMRRTDLRAVKSVVSADRCRVQVRGRVRRLDADRVWADDLGGRATI